VGSKVCLNTVFPALAQQECAERLAKFAESGPVDISDFLLPLFLNLLVKESRLSLDESRLV